MLVPYIWEVSPFRGYYTIGERTNKIDSWLTTREISRYLNISYAELINIILTSEFQTIFQKDSFDSMIFYRKEEEAEEVIEYFESIEIMNKLKEK